MQRNNKPARIVKGTAKQPTLKDASGIWTLDEAMQAHRANAWPQPDLLQPVPKSLKFKWVSGGGTGLYRYGMRGGDQRKFTLSTWFKKGAKMGVDDLGFLSTNWGTSYASLHIATNQANEGIQIYDWGSGLGGVFSISTTPVFRDPSAWYHLVIAVDTTQTVAFNRIKIWVNGVQITDFYNNNSWNTLEGGFPSLNYSTPVNRPGGLMTVGVSANNDSIMSSKTFDGQLAEYNFIDGAALTPTFFGTTTSTGRWIPKPYTGSYGTNGFYLPFDNATTSQTLGYDASVNGTTTYDADQDPYRGSVALHLTGNGPVGGQNNTFVDSSLNNISIVRSGSATQGSFSPFLIQDHTPYNPAVHGASAYFGTSNTDNVYAASNSALAIGTNNFTIEFWANWTAWTGNQRFILMGQSGASNIEISRDAGTDAIKFYISSLVGSYTWTPATNTWHHIALVRTSTGSGGVSLYINGVLQATGTSATSISANNFFVGGLNWAADYNMQGYISNVRVINGAAVYTTNFTPSMRPFGSLTNNLLTFSEDLANTNYWSNPSSFVVANSTIAPDGTPTGAKLVGTNTSGVGISRSLPVTSGLTYTWSFYAKAGEETSYQLQMPVGSFGSGTDRISSFNLITGTATNSGVITNVGNGWWRCSITSTAIATGNASIQSYIAGPTGDSVKGLYIWGPQFEVAGSVTNYTPTPANFSTAPALLLNFANAAVVDTVGANNLLTVSGATLTSASKYGSGAMTFNGTSDYLTMANTPFTFNGSFTIELWGRTTSNQSVGSVFSTFFETSPFDSAGLGIKVVGGGTQACVWSSGSQILTGTSSIIDGYWHHIAVTRDGATMNLFVDGQLQSQFSSTATFSAGTVVVGGSSYNSYAGGWLLGQVDDLRVTKGVARYTSDFTPPARALPEVGGDSFATKGINAGVVRSFTTTGSTTWTAPSDVTQVEVLVVAGGGSGGNFHGGGGGAGGLIYNNRYPVTPGQTYTVAVGAGGASVTVTRGNNGGNSQFGNLIAIGGGGGGNEQINRDGVSGGSGGGSSYGAGRTAAPGTAGQGFAGGIAPQASAAAYAAAGGGGAGGLGGDTPNTSQGGAGGVGLQFSISGAPTFYAAGGGGSVYNAAGIGIGGSSIGGNGGSFTSNIAATNGATNTGSGGGGGERASGANNSGAGGSGIVIIRYTTAFEVGYTEDSLVDSPTNYGHDMQLGGEVISNYCTWNNIAPPVDPTLVDTRLFSNGNLTYTSTGSTGSTTFGTISTTTGKWYWEITMDNIVASGAPLPGCWLNDQYRLMYRANGTASTNTGVISITGLPTYTNGDVISIAVDVDAGYIWYAKNGVWIQGSPLLGTNPVVSWTANTKITPMMHWDNVNGAKKITANFGQSPFIYAAPAGFNALNTKSLPKPTGAALNPNLYFDVLTYTGDNAYPRTVTGLNFQPDLVWVKDRRSSGFHRLFDCVRGATSSPSIYSNSTSVEGADNLAFTSNGFTYSSEPYGGGMNLLGNSHVAWCWKAGGAPVSNTAGTITSQVSANTASGFSIVTWSGTNANGATIGHGLTSAPAMFIIKARNATTNWYVWHTGLAGSTYGLSLNANDVPAVFTYGTATAGATTITAVSGANGLSNINGTSTNYVGYFWSEVPGFSKFGSYTGNGIVDGPFINTGFKPRWIMIKRTDAVGDWQIRDTVRDPLNGPNGSGVVANGASAESAQVPINYLSNGFKISDTGGFNTSTATYIYMAFAENPFKDSTGASPANPTRTPVATVFGYSGTDQNYVVPSGVTKIKVAVWGAGGSAGTPTTSGALSGNGGGAGAVEGYLDVIPGETLTIKVGQGVDALAGTVGNGSNTTTVLAASIYGGGGVNGIGDGSGSNAGTAGAGGGASSIIRASTSATLLVAAGGGGAAGAGYTGSNPSASGGAGGAGAGTGGAGRGISGNPSATYAGGNGTGGGGGGGGGGSGSNANVGNGDAGVGGTNTVPATCTGYSGSSRTPGNTSSALWDGTAGYGGIAPVAGGSITTPDGRIVIIG